jgi:hypothetical protein
LTFNSTQADDPKGDIGMGLIERLREIGQPTCDEAAREIERLQAELGQKVSDAEQTRQLVEDLQRESVALRDRVKLLESALETIARQAHKALEVE